MLTSNYFDTNSSTLNPIRNELYKIEFGDQRLNNRSLSLIENLAKSPKASINATFDTLPATLAAYRFFANPKVTPQSMLTPHRQQSIVRASSAP
jgi:hypothetical protein